MSRMTQYSLFENLRIVTAGNLIGAMILVEIAVSDDLVDLTDVEEMTLVVLTEGISAQLRWNVYFASGYARNNEISTGPFALGTAIAANGPFRNTAYSTVANFMCSSRFLLAYWNNSGALQESALVSARLLVKRVS